MADDVAAAPSAPPLSDVHAMLSEMERDLHPHRANRIANLPEVLPWVRGYHDRLDLGPAIANKRNVALFGDHGGILFVHHSPGTYEAHTQVAKDGRGRWALTMTRAALMWMFSRTDAVEIMTKVPRGNLAARTLARAIGGVRRFTNQRGWIVDMDPVPADVFSLTIQDWMVTAPGLVERGHWFHEKLEAEYARLGKSEQQHPDDADHDRYVGAAAEMIFGGQPHKGVVFYNRWAVMAGYQPVELTSLNPLTIDIREALIIVRGEDFWVPTLLKG